MLTVLALLAVLAARATAAPGQPYDDVTPADDAEGAELYDGSEPPLVDGDTAASSTIATNGAAIVPSVAPGAMPPVREVVAAALRAGGLAGNPAPGWRTRARLAALVPQLSVRAGQDDTWKEIADPTLGHVITYGISASWRLERLVYEPSELRIASVDVLRRRERRRLAWYVISLYRAWRRTQNEDIAAQLDVVTDGWFSQSLAKPLESR